MPEEVEMSEAFEAVEKPKRPTKPAVIVRDLHKEFILPQHKHTSLKQAFVNLGKRNLKTHQKVLDGISFEVNEGDFFGIVGRNGSGKSTLLKILAGVYVPTSGGVQMNGNLTPFIELGVGFNPELSGRDNVFLNGALLGFSRKEMAAMYDDIVEFAELEPFMDQKLKNYSSGMQVRLAFSIAIQARNDILIFDEVLAVGDEAFQQKCINVFEKFKAAKQTIILVTHDMETVKRFCNRAMLIHDGKVAAIGSPFAVADQYSKLNLPDGEAIEEPQDQGKKASVITVAYRGENGAKKSRFSQGDRMVVDIHWPSDLAVKNANILLFKNTGEYVFGTSTFDQEPGMAQGGSIRFEMRLNLSAGNYRIEVGVFGDGRKDLLDYMSESPEFVITRPPAQLWSGLTNLEHHWTKQ